MDHDGLITAVAEGDDGALRELAQVQHAGFAGQAGVAGQEPGQRELLLAGDHRLDDGALAADMLRTDSEPDGPCQ